MGIPAFYRWLIEQYPRSVVEVQEDSEAFTDTRKPNPNGVEFDNLYLDMNGIIHPCFHPEKMPQPESYDEVFEAVFKYIDRIFSLIRPRKLLYMAIDGVAPRAKMNQQRARRFRAAKDAADEASMLEKRRAYSAGDGKAFRSEGLDSNVITPGTEFMELLSSALQYYIHLRINQDPGWQGIKVILSDASVPGEGEHKIMSYIRLQRNLPGFDPNTRHCLYGLDADLIMLGLSTHEVHFSILREDVQRPPASRYMNKMVPSQNLGDLISRQKFQFVNLWVLRDYLAESLKIPDPTVEVDLERLIDDFVFMCVFVGNDFLPHVPSLEISEGAIDLLMVVYKKEFVQMGGYLTDSSEVILKRVEHFIQSLAAHENSTFKRRKQEQMTWNSHSGHRPANMLSFEKQSHISANHANSKAGSLIDKVKLGEDGWKERYYYEKFEVQTDDDCEKVKKDAVFKYVEGICWVMHYYYQGVCSWQWYYPYHYAPFASDFHGLDELNIHFALGKPFKPFDQLMGVLPAASAQALPFSYRKLMTDSSSPILDFYPTEFELDLNGRKQNWKAVCKLPFIDESRLLTEIASVEHTLTDEEKRRNTLGLDKLFFHISLPIAAKIFDFAERNKDNPKLCQAKVKRKINPMLSAGMNGYICISDKPICPSEISSPLCDMERIMKNNVLFVFYKLPDFHAHIPRPPDGVSMPEKSISHRDLLRPPTLWHEKIAVVESRFTRRSIPPKSVAGPCLAKLAYQLVSETYRLSSSEDHGEVSVVPNSEDHGQVSVVPSSVDQGKVSVLSSENHGKSATNEDHGEVGRNKHTLDRRDRRKRMKLRKLMASLDSETHEKVNGSSDDHGKVNGSNEDQGKVKGSSEDHEEVKGSIENHEKFSRSNKDHGKANGSAVDLGEDAKNKRTLVRREKRKRMKLRKLMSSLESEDREKVNGSSDDHGKVNRGSDDHGKINGSSEDHEKVEGRVEDHEKVSGSSEDHGKANESTTYHGEVGNNKRTVIPDRCKRMKMRKLMASLESEHHEKVNGSNENHGRVNRSSEDHEEVIRSTKDNGEVEKNERILERRKNRRKRMKMRRLLARLESEQHEKVNGSIEDHGKANGSTEDHGKVNGSTEDHGEEEVIRSTKDNGEVEKNERILERRKNRRKRMKMRRLLARLESEQHEKVNGSIEDHEKANGSTEDHGKVNGSTEDHGEVNGISDDGAK